MTSPSDGVGTDVESALPYPGDEPGQLDQLRQRILDGRQALAHAFDLLRDGKSGLAEAWDGDEADLASSETRRLVSACRQAVTRADGATGAIDDHYVTVARVRARVDAIREQWSDAQHTLMTIALSQHEHPASSVLCAGLGGGDLDTCGAAQHDIQILTAGAKQQMSDAKDQWWAQVRIAENSAQQCRAALLAACAGSAADEPGLSGTHVGLADTMGIGGLVFDDRVRSRFGRGTWYSLSDAQQAYFLSLARAELGPEPTPRGWSLRAVWADLDPLCRQALIHHDPARWGNANGVPAADRDQANRLALTAALADIRVRANGLQPPLPPPGTDPTENPDAVTATLLAAGYSSEQALAARGTLAVAYQLQRASSTAPDDLPVQLLLFDPHAFDGRGRAAIGLGDVATADNVAMLVPGMTSQVPDYLDDQVTNALNVVDAVATNDLASTAAVAYIGYRAPDLGWDVVDQDFADQGATLVASDVGGLRMMRTDGPGHLTVIAHSYGSTTTATAFAVDHAGAGSGTTDLVLIGSPGAGRAATAKDLSLPAGHVWVGSASSDPVTTVVQAAQDPDVQTDAGCAGGAAGGVVAGSEGGPAGMAIGALVGCVLGATGVRTTAEVVGADLGQDPAGERFGGTRFAAETPSDNEWNIANHSLYYDKKSESLSNIVDVVVGDYDAVTTVPARPESGTHYDGDDPAAAHTPHYQPPGG